MDGLCVERSGQTEKRCLSRDGGALGYFQRGNRSKAVVGTTSGGNISDGPYSTLATTNIHWALTVTDGLGRTTTAQTGYNTGGTSTLVSDLDTYYNYCVCSPAGKAQMISQPFTAGGAKVFTTYAYDALGRTLTVTLPDGASTTQYSYQGN